MEYVSGRLGAHGPEKNVKQTGRCPKEPKQERGQDKVKASDDVALCSMVLPFWQEKTYMERYLGPVKEELEEKLHEEAKHGSSFATDAGRVTDGGW